MARLLLPKDPWALQPRHITEMTLDKLHILRDNIHEKGAS